jgi:hypothetical protein
MFIAASASRTFGCGERGQLNRFGGLAVLAVVGSLFVYVERGTNSVRRVRCFSTWCLPLGVGIRCEVCRWRGERGTELDGPSDSGAFLWFLKVPLGEREEVG